MSTLAPAPSEGTGEDPFEVFSGVGPQLGLLLLLASVAVAVVWISRRRAAAHAAGNARRARPDWADPKWRATVERLRDGAPTPIAAARAGTVRVVATLVSAPTNLGGPAARERVWSNLHGAGPETAIAAEIVFAADDSGRCAIEQLEHARVIAPMAPAAARRGIQERDDRDRRRVALCLGDEVELIGTFAPDRAGSDSDPRALVYGTLGARGPLEIRVLSRPPASDDTTAARADEAATIDGADPT
ncbi:MAG: hypothetical protein IPH07_17000 [Deltaproteobacteria bacterium]|nr:hypothetical protein [Deltaproteobacteria bacterium]MBK8719260.1 hypothetical protein [Deltaproteobacteria bacterium]MBP7291217.1 hypothetical protein [Nannocystaceae bacterium]